MDNYCLLLPTLKFHIGTSLNISHFLFMFQVRLWIYMFQFCPLCALSFTLCFTPCPSFCQIKMCITAMSIFKYSITKACCPWSNVSLLVQNVIKKDTKLLQHCTLFISLCAVLYISACLCPYLSPTIWQQDRTPPAAFHSVEDTTLIPLQHALC